MALVIRFARLESFEGRESSRHIADVGERRQGVESDVTLLICRYPFEAFDPAQRIASVAAPVISPAGLLSKTTIRVASGGSEERATARWAALPRQTPTTS